MQSRIIGLVADPELPTEIAENFPADLADVLASSVSDRIEWQVHVITRQLPLNSDGQIVVWETADQLIESEGWDYMVCLTELTRRVDQRFTISDVNRPRRAALISLPALGPIRLTRQARNAVVRVARVLLEPGLQPGRSTGGRRAMRHLSANVRSPRRSESTDDRGEGISSLPLSGISGRARLLAGMVRINRPYRLIPSLSGAFAAAAAVAAFGIFYSSIWSMAASLTPARLIGISIISVVAMVAWLTGYNGMWEKPGTSSGRPGAAMNNAATIATLSIGVTCFYLVLFGLTLLAALAIIPGDYMQTVLGQPATPDQYGALAWLSTSMGTIAGALGSSFESDSAIRNATYGRRELERYEVTHNNEEE